LAQLHLSRYESKLLEYGCELVEDVETLTEAELIDDVGMKKPHARRLLKHVAQESAKHAAIDDWSAIEHYASSGKPFLDILLEEIARDGDVAVRLCAAEEVAARLHAEEVAKEPSMLLAKGLATDARAESNEYMVGQLCEKVLQLRAVVEEGDLVCLREDEEAVAAELRAGEVEEEEAKRHAETQEDAVRNRVGEAVGLHAEVSSSVAKVNARQLQEVSELPISEAEEAKMKQRRQAEAKKVQR
jgi:hypothetical protein